VYLFFPKASALVITIGAAILESAGAVLVSPSMVAAHVLAKIMEISVGVNLALSFIDEFSGFALALASRVVQKLDPKHNPTLAEAVSESAQESGAQLGAKLDPEKLQGIFLADLTSLMANLDSGLGGLLNWVKKLGYMTALLSYAILVRVEIGHEVSIPMAVAHTAWIGAAFPIFLHMAGSLVLSIRCRYLMTHPNNHDGTYRAFIQQALRKLAQKSATLSSPDLVGKDKR
jgi:hypothetical protein